jgi:hypothetical protein
MAQMQALLKIKADVQGGGAVQSLASNLGSLKSSADKATSGFKGMATAAAGLATTIGAAALVRGIKGVMNAFSEFQRDTNLLENGLKNLGGTAPQQFDILMKSADKLGKLTLFNESDFTQGFGLLTSFTNISVKQFDRLGAAAADLAQTSGTDVKSAFMQLGKALNDPVKGLTALNRAGVQFTDEQKAMIESMVDVGNVAGAQEMILKELERQYGGNAAAAAQGYAGALDSLGESFYDLQKALGPFIDQALTPLVNSLTGLVNFITERAVPILDSLPGPLKTVVGIVAALAVGIAAIAGPLLLVLPGLVALGKAIAGLKIGATIAGWACVQQAPPSLPSSAAFSGLLAFFTGTLLPGLLAFFSGPVGWTVLAVAAVVAMAILFRKPLTDFATWLVSWGKPISSFWAGLWNGLVNVVNTAATTIKSVFTGVGTAIKAVLNGVLRGVFGAVNGAIANINGLINRANALSARVKGPQLPTLPRLSVPQFAQGGVVTGPTLAMVGEGGEAEYIIPASKMAAASANYLNGARGGAVIPAYASGGFVGGSAQINVTTGPVMQQGGQQYVTMADLERAMRKTADGVYASLRTPAGRYAVGTR